MNIQIKRKSDGFFLVNLKTFTSDRHKAHKFLSRAEARRTLFQFLMMNVDEEIFQDLFEITQEEE